MGGTPLGLVFSAISEVFSINSPKPYTKKLLIHEPIGPATIKTKPIGLEISLPDANITMPAMTVIIIPTQQTILANDFILVPILSNILFLLLFNKQ